MRPAPRADCAHPAWKVRSLWGSLSPCRIDLSIKTQKEDPTPSTLDLSQVINHIRRGGMSRLPTKLQSYLQVLNQWRPAGFGRILGVDAKTLLHKDSNPGCSLFQRGEGGQYIFRYEVPIQACVDSNDANVTSSTGISTSNGRDNGEAKVLPLSGLLAVFDELTTLAILSEDRNNRPGVSTALSAELSSHGLMNLPRAGSIIDISVRVLKVGKIMGFANAVVTNPKGEVIATGKHTKFLPHASYLQGLMLGRFLPMLSAVSNFSQITNDNPSSSSISSVQEMVSFDPSSQPSMRVNKEFINPGGSCHVSQFLV